MVPKTLEELNVVLPESVRVTNTRAAEYFTLLQRVGRFWGKNRGSWWKAEAKTKVVKKLLDEARATVAPKRFPYASHPLPGPPQSLCALGDRPR